MSISADAGEPETPKEEMSIPNQQLWKMSASSEVKKYAKKGMDYDEEKQSKRKR